MFLLGIAIAVGIAFAQPSADFVLGFLPNIPDQYVVASLSDIQSSSFADYYNTAGINLVQSFPAEASEVCCVVTVNEGLLSYGISNDYANYIQPFSNSGSAACIPATQPNSTTFGIPASSTGPYAGMWIHPLIGKEQKEFRIVNFVSPNATTPNCSTSSMYLTTIFKYAP